MDRSRALLPLIAITALLWSCAEMPAASAAASPLVMLALSKDATWFHEAYPDNTDLNGDGALDVTYVDALTYAGYFHPRLCYRYDDANRRFRPAGQTDAAANHHYCLGTLSDSYSGNFLNWATMTRLDLLRRTLYGGLRSTDTSAITVLERAHLPPE